MSELELPEVEIETQPETQLDRDDRLRPEFVRAVLDAVEDGMIGTALTGTLVTHLYASGVKLALDKDHASHWYPDLSDPQILINREAQDTLLSQLGAAGHNGALLLEAAREALVAAIHIGLALAAIVAVISLWQSRRVPPIQL